MNIPSSTKHWVTGWVSRQMSWLNFKSLSNTSSGLYSWRYQASCPQARFIFSCSRAFQQLCLKSPQHTWKPLGKTSKINEEVNGSREGEEIKRILSTDCKYRNLQEKWRLYTFSVLACVSGLLTAPGRHTPKLKTQANLLIKTWGVDLRTVHWGNS